MNYRPQHNRSAEAGFTLLEILLVVIIISMLVGVAVVNLAPKIGESKKTAAQDQIHNFSSALDLYELDNGILPTTEQGLQALIAQPTSAPAPGNWKGPYLKPPIIRKDPWYHDYVYQNPGTHNTTSYDLSSPGPDGVAGNEDDLAIGNDSRLRENGFTLIELSIAVFIIAIIIAVTIPSFVRSYNAEVLNATGRTIATSCEFAKLNAVLHQQKVGYYVDMDRQTIWLMQGAQTTTNDTADSASDSAQVLKTIPMPSRIGLSSAQLGELMPQVKGQVEATFYPNGTCDAFAVTLHGVEKGNGLEVIVDPVTCRGMLWPIKL